MEREWAFPIAISEYISVFVRSTTIEPTLVPLYDRSRQAQSPISRCDKTTMKHRGS